MEEGLVSIITPCYNGAKYISETIDSVIAQTYPKWEMLVVDDGSKDNSADPNIRENTGHVIGTENPVAWPAAFAIEAMKSKTNRTNNNVSIVSLGALLMKPLKTGSVR